MTTSHSSNMNMTDIAQPLLTVADFNADGVVNDSDIQELNSRIAQSNYHPLYDLNADLLLDGDDLQIAETTIGQTVPLLDQQIAQVTQATMKYYGPGGLENAIADGYAPLTQELFGHGIHFFNPVIASQVGNSPQLVLEQPVGLNYDSQGNLYAVFYIRPPKLLSGAIQDPLNPLVLQQEIAISGQVTIDTNDDFPPTSFDTLLPEDWHTHRYVWITGIGTLNSELVYFEEDVPPEMFNARVLEKANNQEPLFPLSDTIGSPKFWMLHGWFHSLNPHGIFANTNPNIGTNAVSELVVNHSGHGNGGGQLIAGTDGVDFIDGTSEGDLMNGFNGKDQILSHEGEDFVWGGRGDDVLYGGQDNDEVYGGPDNDFVSGNLGADRLFGATGNDTVYGNQDDDSVYGGEQDDILLGNEGSDYIQGDAGKDTIYGGQSGDTILGGEGDDLIFANKANDLVHGGAGNDVIYGNEGNDTVNGDEGNDFLHGGQENDLISGGSGVDTLTGGLGDDTFVIGEEMGTDIIEDFTNGSDLIGLTDGLTFAQLTFSGNNIIFNGDTLATLTGIDTNTLTSDNFITL